MIWLQKSLFFVLMAVTQFSHALDTKRACDELEEQQQALISTLSTTLEEANLAGQCIGWKKIKNGYQLNVFKACTEFLEQRNNLLGDLSTTFIEANQAGMCLGAVYATCSNPSYTSAATSLVGYGDRSMYKREIERVVGCYGRY